MKYYAKKDNSGNYTVTVGEHLADVSAMAKTLGREVDMENEAWLSGILHDFGKYSRSFQNVLNGTQTKIDHAFCGATMLYIWKNKNNGYYHYSCVMEAVAGHHDGLVSAYELVSRAKRSIGGDTIFNNADKTCALKGQQEYAKALENFREDFPDFKLPLIKAHNDESVIQRMLRTRMLFSCLVDADYTVSGEKGYSEPETINAKECLLKLYDHMSELKQKSSADPRLNAIRGEVFEECGKSAGKGDGLYTLTAPTGVGKTLSLLHFALKRCELKGRRRIIVVLPFLSLADQIETEYRNIIGDVLVDHSQNRMHDIDREIIERWDAPFIITTSVKFFETLFSATPTDCRKLHSIADSVVIFDEAQSLPADLSAATVSAVNSLCGSYNCDVVFSTATQPDFSALEGAEWQPVEILPEYEKYYTSLKRVNVEWQVDEPVKLFEIAERISQEKSVCAIVNKRKQAKELFSELYERSDDKESVFMISTDLCAAHRLEIIGKIKDRLKEDMPCRVVSTQCIEAGVDLDFEVMYRAVAPLESIIQAAGRCNRNGRLENGGKVVVFGVGDDGYPGNWYKEAAFTVKNMLYSGGVDINSPDCIKSYYKRLFGNAKQKAGLTKAIEENDYANVEKEYRLIENQGVKVVVPWSGDMELFDKIRRIAEDKGLTKELMKLSAPITVSVWDKKSAEAYAKNISYLANRYGNGEKSDYYILLPRQDSLYDEKTGLTFPTEEEPLFG